MKLWVIEDRVALRPKRKEKVGSFILADNVIDPAALAEVALVGDGKMADGSIREMVVKVGDIVSYNTETAHRIKVDGTEYLIVDQSDVFGVHDA